MKMNFLGSTGILVSCLGLGTVKFGRNQGVKYPQAFSLPTDKEMLNLLTLAKDHGINFLDTAPAYGSSEERLGPILKNQRHDWIVSTKVGENFDGAISEFDFSKASIKQSIERSLQRLQTDYLDCVLVHSDGNDEKIIADGALLVLAELKSSGTIRSFGMSTKTISGGLLAVDNSDVVMVTYNPLQSEEKAVIDYAFQKNKGVLIKKAFASGHLDKISGNNPTQTAIVHSLSVSGVSSVILGTLNPLHLLNNIECADQFSSGCYTR